MTAKRPYRNVVLATMPDCGIAQVEKTLEWVDLLPNDILARPDAEVSHVYFLESGIAAVTSVASDTRRTVVGLHGRDGMGPVPAVLGVRTAPQQTMILVPGGGYRVATALLLAALAICEPLRRHLLLYAHLFTLQTADYALSNAVDGIDVRLARQLLMMHDRVDSDRIAVTHEGLSVLLSVRRASITTAIHVLEGHRLIANHRGEIAIRDRSALQVYAGEAYRGPQVTRGLLFEARPQ